MPSLGGLLARLLGRGGGPGRPADHGLYLRVRCDACGEIVQARVNPTADLSLADDGQTYFTRKVLIGQRCFRPIEVRLRYADLHGRELEREVIGGTSVE